MGDSSLTSQQQQQQPPQWDESIVLEYEKRVEPFTSLFVKDLLDPIFKEEKDKKKEASPSLLDVGCGAGCGTLMALEAGFQVIATDVSQAMVDRTRERAKGRDYENIYCLVADGQKLSSNSDLVSKQKSGFDYAIAAFSLIFFPDPAKGLIEIYKLLSDGGKVLLTAWGTPEETPGFQIFPDAFRAVLPEREEESKPDRIAGSPEALQNLLGGANFRNVDIVGPISHSIHVPSAEAYYDRFALTSPNTRRVLEKLDESKRAEVKAKVMELAKERGGQQDGSISIPSMAYFAYGTKQ